jgi:uncharacterized Fe-S radical SAM superfamily protein PflX
VIAFTITLHFHLTSITEPKHSACVVICVYCTIHSIQHYPLGGIAFADTHLHKHSATVQQATTATATAAATATATLPGSIELVDMKDSHHDGSSSPRLHATPAAKLFDSKGECRFNMYMDCIYCYSTCNNVTHMFPGVVYLQAVYRRCCWM